MEEFAWPVRVYYEDTDSGGVVYYANYLKFMERARTEWLRSLGVEQDRVRDQDGVLFAVRSVAVEYLQPARFNDLLQVLTAIVEVRKASLTFSQRVVLGEGAADSDTLCHGRTKVACIDSQRLRPRPIPPYILAELTP